ncbi:SDR family oxidoreductase [Prolixibacteraceae bacterium Z1-6]|uniref:SDR family oxidoreductase n=1 Tax=Draconibacterium aestuarii TaxID=2998507 RepID=A0A9X3J7G8_9BACT|nr:SDR family oxidoreductase [Prolixibacteraceae bacterium Z1-6]
MTILVVGATGATGRLLVADLLKHGQKVKAVVRSSEKLSEFLKEDNLQIITSGILDLSDAEMTEHVKDCEAVASCLGHNLTFKGMFGHPRRLVTDTARRLCAAIVANNPEKPVKYVLMNTTGNRNHDLHEPISFAQKCVIAIIRLLIPPHSDNENAADYLRTKIGKNNKMIEWTAVRPDGLIDEQTVSNYTLHASPTRSAIFNPGKTSRINVARFMAQLLTDTNLWNTWKGQMPVIYNAEPTE